ncbi:MAG TPA: M1 family aminopeptidase, partial [candidate division Zixibacteria bacterium]|nr:M1 family aminopeptidase [candidate division Zixibacteria bacterium]
STHLSYTRASNVVTVTLNQPYNTDEEFEFTIYYYGHPVEGGFQAFSFDTRLGKQVISSLSEPYFARTWWPCKDRPDDKADSFHIAITVDTLFYVGSNGTLDSTITFGNNAHTFYYTEHHPMTSYLFSVAISPYTVWYDKWVYNNGADTMPVVNAVFSDQYAASVTGFGVTPGAITAFSNYFGIYPFYDEKYGHSNFTWGGGMEHQTMTSMVGSSFGFATSTVVHELGHQWWGDMITCQSWPHIWLNEGFASYCEALYFEATQGTAAYHSYMNGMQYTGDGSIYITDTSSVYIIFGSIVYDKGAWVLHMLRGILGDSVFFAGIRDYYNSQYKFGSATTEEFRDVMEAASGVDLNDFFQDWIYGTYFPTYRYSYYQEPSDTGGYDLYLYVEQRQSTDPQVFHMPVQFAFSSASQLGGADTVKLDINQENQLFHLTFPSQITNVQLDPVGWILKSVITGSWTFKIVTLPEEVSGGLEHIYYQDTIKARGATSTVASIPVGVLPPGYSMSPDGVISGVCQDTGTYAFTVRFTETSFNTYTEGQFSIHVAPFSFVPGDADGSGSLDIADLIFMVDYMFNNGPAPALAASADVNGDCKLDISDIIYLVDYQYADGPPPVFGCAP